MNSFFLSSAGLSHSGQQALQAVLALSENALSSPWHYRQDTTEANVVFAFLHNPEGSAFWQQPPHSQPTPIVVACSKHAETDAKWRLNLATDLSIPSRRELVALLNDLSAYLATSPAQTDATPASPDTLKQERIPTEEHHPAPAAATEPDRHFLGLLQQAIAAGQDTAFTLPQGRNWLMVYPQARKFYSSLSAAELQSLLLSGIGDIRQCAMGEGTQPDPTLATRSLADLLWQAALAVSHGRLRAGHTPQDIVRLKHWPQIAQLPSQRTFLRLASFMLHNTASLETIALLTGTPLAQVIDFHNACEAIGLLERHAQAELAGSERGDEQMRELSRKISSRLARPALDRAA